jgi:hypothetical protein
MLERRWSFRAAAVNVIVKRCSLAARNEVPIYRKSDIMAADGGQPAAVLEAQAFGGFLAR